MTASCSIHLNHVNLSFTNGVASNRLKDFLFNRKRHNKSKIHVLKNINLTIEHGETVGLLGLNGAGKSTLLKTIAGIYCPDNGKVTVNGHVCPLFELATGFESELTGWENIRIRALLMGMPKKEINQKIAEIAAFADLGEFIDYPVRTYSSGMFIRLAFAVSTAVDPEILLLDEVLGAGDINFAKKAKARMDEFIQKGKILVLTSHSLEMLESLCARIIWLEKGAVIMDAPAQEVLEAYKARAASSTSAPEPESGLQHKQHPPVAIKKIPEAAL